MVMGKTSKIMYTIGRIFNIVELVCTALMVVAGIILTALHGNLVSDEMPEEAALGTGLGILIAGIISFIIVLVVYLLATKAQKSIGNGTTEKAPHIMMIVIGAIGGDIFYLLGGIFGLVAEGREDER